MIFNWLKDRALCYGHELRSRLLDNQNHLRHLHPLTQGVAEDVYLYWDYRSYHVSFDSLRVITLKGVTIPFKILSFHVEIHLSLIVGVNILVSAKERDGGTDCWEQLMTAKSLRRSKTLDLVEGLISQISKNYFEQEYEKA